MRHVILWVAQILLAVFFVFAGAGHLFTPIDELALRAPWVADAPVALVRFIGVAELLGAVGLLLPRATGIARWLTPLAAFGLAQIMLLAIPLHAMRGEWSSLWMHPVVIAVAMFVGFGRWNDLTSRFGVRPSVFDHTSSSTRTAAT